MFVKNNLAYLISFILLILWFCGYILFSANSWIHTLFLLAVLLTVFKISKNFILNSKEHEYNKLKDPNF